MDNKGYRYWHQGADERFGDPPPKVDPGAFSGQKQVYGRPQEDPLGVHCFCVCISSALLGDLGVSRSMSSVCPVELS